MIFAPGAITTAAPSFADKQLALVTIKNNSKDLLILPKQNQITKHPFGAVTVTVWAPGFTPERVSEGIVNIIPQIGIVIT
ncbi:MAG: hypothetical protein R2784_11165 [Saprospiraceae bacterium]